MPQASTGVRRLQAGALSARAYQTKEGVKRAELISAARDACEALLLPTGVRAVLMELASCYGEQAFDAGLIVWPSNLRLRDRTGLAERTIRLAIARIISLGLIEPRDSANRKRFAIKRDGAIIDAYGFNLAPIWGRREEFALALLARRHARAVLNRQYDEITIARKAVEEALRLVERPDLEKKYGALVVRTPRRGVNAALEELIADWTALRREVEDAFHSTTHTNENTANAGTWRRHKEQNNEPPTGGYQDLGDGEKKLEPSLIIEACPIVVQFYPNTPLDPASFVDIGAKLRPTIGAHPDAWREALETIGPMRAAALVCYVLQIHDDDVATGQNRIRSPGGLFRALTRRLSQHAFDLTAELHALKRRRATKKGGR